MQQIAIVYVEEEQRYLFFKILKTRNWTAKDLKWATKDLKSIANIIKTHLNIDKTIEMQQKLFELWVKHIFSSSLWVANSSPKKAT